MPRKKGNRNKERGNELEREIVKLAESFGLPAKRAWGSNGEAMGEAADVDCKVADIRIQAKRRKCLPEYLQIPDSCDAVVFRQDRGPKLALIHYEYLLELLGGTRPCRIGYESAGRADAPSVKAIAGVPTPPAEVPSSACESSQTMPVIKVAGFTSTSLLMQPDLPPLPKRRRR